MIPNILAQSEVQTFLELAPILPISRWWHFCLLALLAIAAAAYIVMVYRWDTRWLSRTTAILLTSLRLCALFAILLFFLGPQQRSETRIVKPSQLAILIDTSLSMGLTDSGEESAPLRRCDSVAQVLENSSLLANLSQVHDVVVYRFGSLPTPEAIVQIPRQSQLEQAPSLSESDQDVSRLRMSQRVAWLVAAFLAMALISLVACALAIRRGGERTTLQRGALPYSMAIWSFLVAVALLATSDLISSRYDIWTSLGWRQDASLVAEDEPVVMPVSTQSAIRPPEVDWETELSPHATSTPLGQALQHVVNQARGEALAGIILLTDGQHNSGHSPVRAAASAADANIPIFAVGIGSVQPRSNLSVSEIQVPTRVFPGDRFKIKAILSAHGLAGRAAIVQVASVDSGGREAETAELEQQLTLPADGDPLTLDFDLVAGEEGRRQYTVRVVPPAQDIDAADNQRSAAIEIVNRKTNVLLIAGGPSRDYQFLKNQLFRDPEVRLHVWLQIAKPGSDQESDELLFDFPTDNARLQEYDCIVAFDPDWRRLTPEQARSLEKWVSHQAGGLIVVAGPVNTPQWTRRPRGDEAIDAIRGLYPVSFYSQGSASLKLGRFGGERAYPLLFSREGSAASFLWLGKSASASAANWKRFPGVYGYYAVNEAKAGADVLANFSDPSTAIDERLPIYLASHFYGSGRVIFQASAEIWRLRRVEVNFFQEYYDGLMRWASQGRLLRDSSRGVLLVDRDRCWIGDQVTCRAILRNAADEPLMATEVISTLALPDGTKHPLVLSNLNDLARPGTFIGQFAATHAGAYRVQLPIPNSVDGQILTADVDASIPDLEKQKPLRNDQLLQDIAQRTRGKYFVGLAEAIPDEGLVSLIPAVDQETYLPGTPSQEFTTKLMAWLTIWLTLVLCLEWTTRRLQKLA